MKVAVLGKSSFNAVIVEQLVKEGLKPVFIENIDDIKSVSGEPGAFLIKTPAETVEAGYIIVAGEPAALVEPETFTDNGKPVVILLDYPCEAPAYMTETALMEAIKLAGKQKKVIFLSRFMRTAGSGLEDLYKKARNLGVAFIRYIEADIKNDGDTGLIHIRLTDGYDEIGIDTFILLKPEAAADSFSTGKLLKMFRLKPDKGISASGSSFFLSPTITSRKGIYFLDGSFSGSLGGEILEQITFTVSEIVIGCREQAKYGEQAGCKERSELCALAEYAEVDPGKCAFCYTCYRACPHAAKTPDYEISAMKNLNKTCQACGICASVCPADAIEIKGKGSDVKVVPNSLKIYCCENSGEIALGKITGELAGIYEKTSISAVSCGGEITTENIMDALKHYEKVLCVTCIDDACRHFDGNKRARLQISRARDMLKAAGLDENRIGYLQVSHAMPNVLRDCIKDCVRLCE